MIRDKKQNKLFFYFFTSLLSSFGYFYTPAYFLSPSHERKKLTYVGKIYFMSELM